MHGLEVLGRRLVWSGVGRDYPPDRLTPMFGELASQQKAIFRALGKCWMERREDKSTRARH